jgi:hypothetical protein
MSAGGGKSDLEGEYLACFLIWSFIEANVF